MIDELKREEKKKIFFDLESWIRMKPFKAIYRGFKRDFSTFLWRNLDKS